MPWESSRCQPSLNINCSPDSTEPERAKASRAEPCSDEKRGSWRSGVPADGPLWGGAWGVQGGCAVAGAKAACVWRGGWRAGSLGLLPTPRRLVRARTQCWCSCPALLA